MGHKHIPYAVTGVPVAPTPVPLRTVFKARLSEGIQSGFVAVISPPTALLTRRIRPTGFRSSSIFSYYNGLTGICQGLFRKFFVKFLVKTEKTGKNGGVFDGTGERACMWEDFLTDRAAARRQMAAWGGAVKQETEPKEASGPSAGTRECGIRISCVISCSKVWAGYYFDCSTFQRVCQARSAKNGANSQKFFQKPP